MEFSISFCRFLFCSFTLAHPLRRDFPPESLFGHRSKANNSFDSCPETRQVLYFIPIAIQDGGPLNSASTLPTAFLSYTILCPALPRFVLDIREMYDRDLRGGTRRVDTGFGMFSRQIFISSVVVDPMVFVDISIDSEQDLVVEMDGLEDGLEVGLPALVKEGTHQV